MVINLEDADPQIEQAFHLAYFIHGDRETAVEIVVRALSKMETAATAQHKRLYYRPAGRPSAHSPQPGAFRSKVSFSQPHLLQRLVYVESEYYERLDEQPGVRAAAGAEELLIRYVKHLVRIAIRRNSFYVTLAVSRLLYSYTTPETMEIYNAVIQDPERVKDDYYFRSRKAVLMRELRERFGDRLRTSRGARGEERFVTEERREGFTGLVMACLSFFTPWGTSCVVPANCDPILDGIPQLSDDGRRAADQVEVNRIHSITDPDCYGRLTQALGFDRPELRLKVPRFFLTGDGCDKDDRPDNRRNPPPFTPDDAQLIKSRLAEQARRRREAPVELLRVMVDGVERARIDLARSRNARFHVAASAELIEVRTRDDVGEVTLATHLLTHGDAGREARPLKTVTVLEDGRKIFFTVTLARGGDAGEAAGCVVEVRCGARSVYGAARAFVRRLSSLAWGRSLTEGRRGVPVAAAVMVVLALVAACAAGVIIFLRRDQSRRQAPPTMAVQPESNSNGKEQTPPASETPNGNAPRMSGTEQPAPVRAGTNNNGASDEREKAPPGGDAPKPVPTEAPRRQETAAGGPERGPENTARRHEERDAGRDTVRSPQNDGAGKSLVEARKVCVQADDVPEAGRALVDALARRLDASGRLSFTSNADEADVCLKLTVRRASGGSGRLVVGARLVNAEGQSLWPTRQSGGGSYNGSAARVATQIVEALLAEIRRQER